MCNIEILAVVATFRKDNRTDICQVLQSTTSKISIYLSLCHIISKCTITTTTKYIKLGGDLNSVVCLCVKSPRGIQY